MASKDFVKMPSPGRLYYEYYEKFFFRSDYYWSVINNALTDNSVPGGPFILEECIRTTRRWFNARSSNYLVRLKLEEVNIDNVNTDEELHRLWTSSRGRICLSAKHEELLRSYKKLIRSLWSRDTFGAILSHFRALCRHFKTFVFAFYFRVAILKKMAICSFCLFEQLLNTPMLNRYLKSPFCLQKPKFGLALFGALIGVLVTSPPIAEGNLSEDLRRALKCSIHRPVGANCTQLDVRVVNIPKRSDDGESCSTWNCNALPLSKYQDDASSRWTAPPPESPIPVATLTVYGGFAMIGIFVVGALVGAMGVFCYQSCKYKRDVRRAVENVQLARGLTTRTPKKSPKRSPKTSPPMESAGTPKPIYGLPPSRSEIKLPNLDEIVLFPKKARKALNQIELDRIQIEREKIALERRQLDLERANIQARRSEYAAGACALIDMAVDIEPTARKGLLEENRLVFSL